MEPEDHPSYGPSYVLQLLASLGIWWGLGRWGGLSNEAQQYEVILLWMFAFRPLSTLIHELGHAAAVRRLAGRPAQVVVGAGSPALKGRLGQLQISFSPVPIVGSQVAGICRYQSDGIGWRIRGWISLAGPGATLLELLVMLALLPAWGYAAVVVRDLFAVGTAMLALNVVTNMLPTPLVRDAGGRVVLGRDGYNALQAFRNARARAPVRGPALAATASLPEVDTAPHRPAFRLGEPLPEADAPASDAPAKPSSDARLGSDAAAAGGSDDPAAPDPAAPRTLAEIWSIQQPVIEQPPAEPAVRSSAAEQQARGDFAQRVLAEIWSGQPAEVEAPVTAITPVRATASQTAIDEAPESIDGKLALAASQLETGRAAEAIPLLEAAVSALQTDPAADGGAGVQLAAVRAALARAYLAARRPRLAIGLWELLLSEPAAGRDAEQRLSYRVSLAQAFRAAGEAGTAIGQLEALVAELGAGDDPERQIDAQIELATTYVVAHRVKDAIAAYETVLPHVESLLGAGHRKALSVRLLLARASLQDGQPELAARSYRNVVTSAERELGPGDKLTRQAQSELTALLRNQQLR